MIPSASQTVGPFFNFGLTADRSLGTLAGEGERIRLEFHVVDGNGTPTPGDSMIELWQADISGFGRLETDADGTCVFDTIKPVPFDGQAPYINVIVFARGILRHLYTRVYFAGEQANAEDRALALVPESRRATLLAQPVAGQPNTWRFDVRLQGEAETVFFDF